jgi:threonyl-tRNA synthetase
MIKITFPDGAEREYPKGSSPMEIAKSISDGLARNVLAAEVNGKRTEASTPIDTDASIKLFT